MVNCKTRKQNCQEARNRIALAKKIADKRYTAIKILQNYFLIYILKWRISKIKMYESTCLPLIGQCIVRLYYLSKGNWRANNWKDILNIITNNIQGNYHNSAKYQNITKYIFHMAVQLNMHCIPVLHLLIRAYDKEFRFHLNLYTWNYNIKNWWHCSLPFSEEILTYIKPICQEFNGFEFTLWENLVYGYLNPVKNNFGYMFNGLAEWFNKNTYNRSVQVGPIEMVNGIDILKDILIGFTRGVNPTKSQLEYIPNGILHAMNNTNTDTNIIGFFERTSNEWCLYIDNRDKYFKLVVPFDEKGNFHPDQAIIKDGLKIIGACGDKWDITILRQLDEYGYI